MTKSSATLANFAVLIVAALAFAVAMPWSRSVLSASMPAADFAIGAAMVTLAFLQIARAASVWLARSESLPWLAAALVVALGLFVAGSAQMLAAQSRDFNWVALGGIAVTLAGVQWQRRCALR